MSKLMLLIFIPAVGLTIALYAVVGVFVYRDARRRGMNALLWTLVALLVPSFIGLIVYLLARNNLPEGSQCAKCGAPVTETYLACPKCGAELAAPCPGCGKQVSLEWKVCPYCKAELPAPQQVTKNARRMSPGLVAAIIALVILVFAALAVALAYLTYALGAPTHSTGIMIGSITNNSTSLMSGSFLYADGARSKSVHLEEGQTITIQADVQAESGNIAIQVDDPDGVRLHLIEGSFNQSITVKAEKTGDYVIKILLDKCKGHYDITWDVD